MSSVEELLKERAKTHGSFENHAKVTQGLKDLFWENVQHGIEPVQAEGIEMILHKIGRICAGNPNEVDHWKDIAGYAALVANWLNNDSFKD